MQQLKEIPRLFAEATAKAALEFSRWRRGVKLVTDIETGIQVEVPRDLNDLDAEDFAFSVALGVITRRLAELKKSQ